MLHFATPQQLAAILVDGSDSLPGPALQIRECGTDSTRAYRVSCTWGADETFLASTREQGLARDFKTADAALNACVEVINRAGARGSTQVYITPNFC